MGVKIYKNGSWQDVDSMKIYENNLWQDVNSMKIYENGAWRNVYERVSSKEPELFRYSDSVVENITFTYPSGRTNNCIPISPQYTMSLKNVGIVSKNGVYNYSFDNELYRYLYILGYTSSVSSICLNNKSVSDPPTGNSTNIFMPFGFANVRLTLYRCFSDNYFDLINNTYYKSGSEGQYLYVYKLWLSNNADIETILEKLEKAGL